MYLIDPLNLCPDCSIIKTPRSRHCSTCNFCVERYDHHCPWVNNCIGAKNHHYFMTFLTFVFVSCLNDRDKFFKNIILLFKSSFLKDFLV